MQIGPSLPWFSAIILVGAPNFAHAEAVDFSHEIVPLIRAHCAECHTNGKYKGSFSLDTRESLLRAKVVLPGKSSQSELIKRITSKDPEEQMPPKGARLTEREVGLFRAWIDQGLPWEPGFSFKTSHYVAPLKPHRPTLPPSHAGHDHPIDRILEVYYARQKLNPPAAVDDATFIRRVYLDVIGLLPAPAELDVFLKDTSPTKRDQLVSRLLADRRAYADHWLTFWNDLLRNDYQGTGYIDGGRKQITGWLYNSLLDNKPYDQFVRELISPTPASEGFIDGIKWRGRVNASQVREIQFSQNVSQVFFGINMKCASCHDSFIDGWKLADAYGLAAVVADGPLDIYRCDKPTGKVATARFLWPDLGNIDVAAPRGRRLEQLARLVTHPENGRFARTIVNRLWQRLMGRGIVHPVDIMGNEPWCSDLLDYLAVYLVDQKYDLKHLIEHIVSSRAYQSQPAFLNSENVGDAFVFHGPTIKRMSAEEFVDAIWMITRSAPLKPAAPIKPLLDTASPPERRFVRAVLVNADALMRSLGRPNREQVVTTRPEILSTLQALDLSNGVELAETLSRGAANLLKANPHMGSAQLCESLYLQSLCRHPTPEEQKVAIGVLGTSPTAESLADLLWIIFMLPEFQLIR